VDHQGSCADAGGDACILLSAFFYSLATVRLGRLASGIPSLRLATAKSVAFALISIAWFGSSVIGQVSMAPALA
jgi:hypothetical protein